VDVGPAGEDNRSFEERGGEKRGVWGRRARTKTPGSFEERGGGREVDVGPAGEDKNPTLF
jgi:hypothetical protein